MGNRRVSRLVTLLLGLALLVGGSWWTLQVVLELRDWLDSNFWAVTRSTGLIVQPGGGLRYGYRVEGWPYVGERTHFFLATPYLDGRHQRWLDANRGSTAVAVFYDPDAPWRAVLVPRVAMGWGPGLWFTGGGLGALAVLLVLFMTRRWRPWWRGGRDP